MNDFLKEFGLLYLQNSENQNLSLFYSFCAFIILVAILIKIMPLRGKRKELWEIMDEKGNDLAKARKNMNLALQNEVMIIKKILASDSTEEKAKCRIELVAAENLREEAEKTYNDKLFVLSLFVP